MIKGKNSRTGQRLYKKAKSIILGGNMLLSKRPEMFQLDLLKMIVKIYKKQLKFEFKIFNQSSILRNPSRW